MITGALAIQLLLPASLQRQPVDPLLDKGRTPEHVLQKQFTQARGLSIRELNGIYPGRCYYFDSPTTPVASVLVVGENDPARLGSVLGPAFNSGDYRMITPLVAREASPNLFDKPDAELRKKIMTAVRANQSANAYPVTSNDSLVVEGMRTGQLERRTYTLRKNAKYFLLRMTCAEDTYCLNYRDGGPTNRVLNRGGESNAICYYWNSVK